MKYTPTQWLNIVAIKTARRIIRNAKVRIAEWQKEIEYQERTIELAIEDIKRENRWRKSA